MTSLKKGVKGALLAADFDKVAGLAVKNKFKFYEGHELKEIAVGDMAQQVLDCHG